MRYVGLIAFLVRVLGIFTGFLFVIIVTRRLSEADFGTWVWIARLIGYVAFPTVVTSFWTTRFIARNFKAAKTNLVLTLIMSSGSTLIYLLISPIAAGAANAPLFFFLLASTQVPLIYLIENLYSIANGIKPQIASYGYVASELSKVVLAFTLMTLLGRTLTSAIISVATAELISVIVLLIFLKDHLPGSFDKTLAWRWIRHSWIPLYSGLSTLVMSALDASIIIAFSGSSLILANYGAAYILYSIIIAPSALTAVLYPKLLRGGDHNDITSMVNLTALLAIPMTAGIFITARPLLYLLNPVYADAVSVARAIIIYAFMIVFMTIFDYIILGTEKVELNIDSKFKDFIKSKLFLLPTINLICGATYLTTLTIVMHTTLSMNLTPAENAFYWALTQLITLTPFFTYKAILARKALHFKIPWREIATYLTASLIMVATLQLLKFDIEYTPSIYTFVYQAAKLAITGGIIYFTILYTFDKYFRELLKTILTNFRP